MSNDRFECTVHTMMCCIIPSSIKIIFFRVFLTRRIVVMLIRFTLKRKNVEFFYSRDVANYTACLLYTSQSILYQVLFQIIKAKITHCFMKHIWCNKIFPKHGKFLTFTNKTNLVAKFSWPVKSLLLSSKSCITSCNSGIRNCYLAIHPQRKWLIKVKILMSENNFFETRIM